MRRAAYTEEVEDEEGDARLSSVERLSDSRGSERATTSGSSTSSSALTTLERPPYCIMSTAELAEWVKMRQQVDVGITGNVVWSVSSAKHGNGVRHLMYYHDLSTFWQSDGLLPHVIRIQLGQLTPIEAMALYVNTVVDQSYSPRVIQVNAGTHEGDMTEIAKVDTGGSQDCGWVVVELCEKAAVTPEGEVKQKVAAGIGLEHRLQGASKRPELRPRTQGEVESPHHGAPAFPRSDQPIPFQEVAAVLRRHDPQSQQSSKGADRWLWCTVIDICICQNHLNGRDCHLRGIRLTGPRYEEWERVCDADAQVDDGVCWMHAEAPLDGVAEELQLR